ncbi:MAG TPA: hypothetical protein EYO84_08905 [Planctomycetes bacterium]|nr:hypothetical protein [Planctomycetota bacterium]
MPREKGAEMGFWERYHRGIGSEEKGWWEAEGSPVVIPLEPEDSPEGMVLSWMAHLVIFALFLVVMAFF